MALHKPEERPVEQLSEMELEALAIDLKNEEQAFLEDIKARKSGVRDEIVARARRSYASQRLRGLGIEPTEALIEEVMKSGEKLPDSGVVVTPETGHSTMEAH
jgi:hypothetical protein